MQPRGLTSLLALAALLLALAGGCSGEQTFAERPGFERWFAQNPPDPKPADRAGRQLLRQHRPVLYTPPDHPGPLDFYRDYIAFGTLTLGDQRWNQVDRARLARHADNPDARFVHQAPADPVNHPVAYGRIDRARLEPFGELTFLTWHYVFRYSGLPAGLPAWQGALAGVFGDPHDWHQLDHYTAATLVLGPDETTPLGLILQHHNTVRGYWLGRDLELADSGRPPLAVAVRSNELYPRPAERTRHRVVRFPTPQNLRWLATGQGEAPWTAGFDRVPAGERVPHKLQFLPQTDPFYRFHGRLGATRLLPGRDGPPGADYNTLPAFKDRTLQFCALRWSGQPDTQRLDALRNLLANPDNSQARDRLFNDCRAFVHEKLNANHGGTRIRSPSAP
jgi:hypothetical protein